MLISMKLSFSLLFGEQDPKNFPPGGIDTPQQRNAAQDKTRHGRKKGYIIRLLTRGVTLEADNNNNESHDVRVRLIRAAAI